jgi:hypothetical protein
MAITFTGARSTENAASATYTVLINWIEASGDVIVVNIWSLSQTYTISSVSDTVGNFYGQIIPVMFANAASGGEMVTFICYNALAASSGTNTVTVVFNASQATATVAVSAYSSDTGFSPILNVNPNENPGATTSAFNSAVTTVANTLTIGWITTGSGGVTTITAGTGVTGTGWSSGISSTNKIGLAYIIATSTGTQTINATVSATNDEWTVTVFSVAKTIPVNTPSIRQWVHFDGTSITPSVALKTAVLSGSTIVCVLKEDPTLHSLTYIRDSVNGVTNYTLVEYLATGSPDGWLWVAAFANTAAGTPTITATFASSSQAEMDVFEVTNMPATVQADGINTNVSASTGTATSGTITTSFARDIIFGAIEVGGGVVTAETGWQWVIDPTSSSVTMVLITTSTQASIAATADSQPSWSGIIAALQGTRSLPAVSSNLSIIYP